MNNAQSVIRSFFLEGPAGRLEALLNAGKADATHAALVCSSASAGRRDDAQQGRFPCYEGAELVCISVLRFNFRGTGLSAGRHDEGRGEIEDVQAALAWLKREFPLPVIFAGFSFGSATGLRAACPDPDVKAIISIGTPVEAEGRLYKFEFLRECTKPKLFVSGDHDQYAPAERLEELVATVADPKELVFIPGDHFFEGHLSEMRMTIESWIAEVLHI